MFETVTSTFHNDGQCKIRGLLEGRVLEKIRQYRALPVRIVIDNGTEFTPKALDQWSYENKVTLYSITPGRPLENGYIESFHGKFREECLNEHWFLKSGRCTRDHRKLADRLQPGAPTQFVGIPDTGGIRNRLCKCGMQKALSTFIQPRLLLRGDCS